MPYVLGTDEAGYGPNLGPLVISASLWEIPSAIRPDALHDCLASLTRPCQPGRTNPGPPILGDSKQLYQSGKGLAALELGVMAAFGVLAEYAGPASAHPHPDSWRTLLNRCDGSSLSAVDAIPWYREFDTPLPIDAASPTIEATARQFRQHLNRIDARLVDLRSRIVFPEAFNRRLEDGFNKAAALSSWTLELVHSLTDTCSDAPLLVHCDKHGGRNRYAALLQHQFPDAVVQTVSEGKLRSVYRWGSSERRVEVRFVAKGDRFLPAALASMISKYLRELAMMAFNAFWRHHRPDLRPTAGYPVDAKRFRQEIDCVARQLRVPEIQLWRNL